MERENRSILLKNKKNLGGVKLKQLGAKISIEFPGSLSKKSHMTGIYSRPLAEENVDRYTCCPGSDFWDKPVTKDTEQYTGRRLHQDFDQESKRCSANIWFL